MSDQRVPRPCEPLPPYGPGCPVCGHLKESKPQRSSEAREQVVAALREFDKQRKFYFGDMRAIDTLADKVRMLLAAPQENADLLRRYDEARAALDAYHKKQGIVPGPLNAEFRDAADALRTSLGTGTREQTP